MDGVVDGEDYYHFVAIAESQRPLKFFFFFFWLSALAHDGASCMGRVFNHFQAVRFLY